MKSIESLCFQARKKGGTISAPPSPPIRSAVLASSNVCGNRAPLIGLSLRYWLWTYARTGARAHGLCLLSAQHASPT